LNGDGFDEVLLTSGLRNSMGALVLVFGRADFPERHDLETLAGKGMGTRIDADINLSSFAVPAGDFNGDWDGDGAGDIAIGSPAARADIVFGKVTREAQLIRGDADSSKRLDITDAIRVLAHLFLGGPPPPAPYPEPGLDPTADGMVCVE